MGLVDQMRDGDRRALARLVTIVENGGADARRVLEKVYLLAGHAHIVGITGPPGAGKSTLVNELVQELRRREQRVAVLAVDPTSPFSGGAILGDRIRMQALGYDPQVFVRSMASRGQLGGLARATGDVLKVLDAAGFDTVIVETVGAGQAEVEIARAAQTTLVVEVPGLGDDVQAIKAGILEIADVFVVNKADRPDAEKTRRHLQAMMQLGHPRTDWDVPVLMCVAATGQGIAAVADAIAAHRAFLAQGGWLDAFERQQVERELRSIVQTLAVELVYERVDDAQRAALLEQIRARALDPWTAAERLLGDALVVPHAR